MLWIQRVWRKTMKAKTKTTKMGKVQSQREVDLMATRGRPLRDRLFEGVEQDEKLLHVPCSEVSILDQGGYTDILAELLIVADEFAEHCAGLSANQIGHSVKIFVVKINGKFTPYINAHILAKGGGIKRYSEACLSRVGKPPVSVRRWKTIQIKYFCPHREATITEWILDRKTAQCIQHEIDHGKGILI